MCLAFHKVEELTMYTVADKEFITTCYTTNLLIGLRGKSIEIANKIKSMNLIDHDSFETSANGIVVVKMERENLPHFEHPIINDDIAYVDGRKFYNKEGMLTNPGNLNFLLRRAGLDLQWTRNKEPFNTFLHFSANCFGTWYANGISRELNLDLDLNTKLKIIAAIYQLGLFHTDRELSNDAIISYILRAMAKVYNYIPTDYVNNILKEYEEECINIFKPCDPYVTGEMLNNLYSLTNLILGQDKAVNIHMVYNSLCKRAIIDSDPLTLAAISLEHPPTFISMMYVILLGGLQSKTGLGKVVDGLKKSTDLETFNMTYKRLVGM